MNNKMKKMRKENPTWRPEPCRGGGRGSQPSAHPQTAPPPWDPLGCTVVSTLYNSNDILLVAYIIVCKRKNYIEKICIVFLSD
jgi:hypothetical protein